jgi:hypothetical protein
MKTQYNYITLKGIVCDKTEERCDYMNEEFIRKISSVILYINSSVLLFWNIVLHDDVYGSNVMISFIIIGPAWAYLLLQI